MGKGVAEDAMIDTLADGIDDFRGRGEIHVCDPEWVEVGALVPLEGAGSASGDGSVEIRHGGMMAKLERGPTTKRTKVTKACVGEWRD